MLLVGKSGSLAGGTADNDSVGGACDLALNESTELCVIYLIVGKGSNDGASGACEYCVLL